MSIKSFLDNLGNRGNPGDTNIPLFTSWEVEFSLPSGLSEVSELEGQSWGDVDTIPGGSIKLLAQSVTQVPDSYNPGDATITNNGGFLPGAINTGRTSSTGRALRIQFLETEKTLADLSLRAWVIVASHYGRIADRPDLKQTVYVTHLSRSGSPRKTFKYYNATPTAVEAVTYEYGSSQITKIGTSWVYDNYSVS
jgi:hypothetical protein